MEILCNHYGGESSQEERFRILSQIDYLEGQTVLDVGCGFDDFLTFLKTKCRIILKQYLGIDMVGEFIEEAHKKHNEVLFQEIDILSFTLDPRIKIDYAIASGIFFLKYDNWEDYVINISSKMFNMSLKRIAINFLSAFSNNPDKFSYYASPARTLKILMMNISNKAVLRHDYRKNDFTVYLYRGD